MMRLSCRVSPIFALVVVAFPLATHSGTHQHGSSNPDDVIYDLSHPWPFHKSGPSDDADGDGVPDGADTCPGTPARATVNAAGCPLDSDGDGVFDGIDRCADTPRGATVDAKGCQADADGDGISDGIDTCPDTPRGATVDAKGCPADADGDGVMNGIDTCPDTPMEYAVDKKGCPVPVSETYQQFLDAKSVSVYIQFQSGKADIMATSEDELRRVGEVLADWPEAKVEIGGHTDSQGSESLNDRLSKQRAESVKSWLVSHYSTIKGRNLSAKGYGERQPIATNDTEEGRSKNRRVTFTLTNADDVSKDIEKRRFKKRGE